MQFDGDVAVPKQQIEVPRSAEDDNSRAAVVDAICSKHGLKFKFPRNTFRFAHTATNHGVRSFTFYQDHKAIVRLS
jgi:hypothetical protein